MSTTRASRGWVRGTCLLLVSGWLTAQEGALAADIDRLVETWRDTPHRSAMALTRELVTIGGPAEPHLRELLMAGLDEWTMAPIAAALARIGPSTDSCLTLRQLLADADPVRRKIAATALGEAHTGEALPALLAALDDTSKPVQAAAARSLASLAREHPELQIETWLQSQLQGMQPDAPSRSRLVALLATLAAEATDARSMRAIRQQVESAIEAWRAAGDLPPAALTEQLVAFGSGADEVLRRLLEAPVQPDVVGAIALAFARTAVVDSSCRSLTSLLASSQPELRAAGALALAEIGRPDEFEALLTSLDDEVVAVRKASAQAMAAICTRNPDFDALMWHELTLGNLAHCDQMAVFVGQLGTPAARRLLVDLLDRPETDAVLAGLQGLWLCGQGGDAQAVLAVFDGGDLIVMRKACLVLGKMKARCAIRGLIDCLSLDHRGLAADAHWALRQITGLRLAADPQLWERWWQLVGSRETQH